MFQHRSLKSLAFATMLATITALSACAVSTSDVATEGGSHMTRVRLYESIDELAEDSAIVIVGTVQSQRVVADIDPITDFTLSNVEVKEVVKGDPS